MRELILALISPLLHKPEAMELKEVESAAGPKFVLIVDREDIGRLIGREGKVVKAIRTLLEASASAKQVEDVRLDVEERPS